MNINFNLLVKKLVPYVLIVLFVYILNSVLFFFLPKSGVEYIESGKETLEYKKYSGFYLTSKSIQNQDSTNRKNIEKLSNYTLKAIYSTPSNKGWITIQKDAKSYILADGESIDNYKLVKLFKRYVVFTKYDKEYKLELQEIKTTESIKNQNLESMSQNIRKRSDGAEVSREYLNSYIQNLDKIWSNIAINEIVNQNQIEGFKIEKINTDSAFGKLGLKEGDILKTVNNKELKSYADAFDIYNNIHEIRYLNIEILRNNEKMELNYEID